MFTYLLPHLLIAFKYKVIQIKIPQHENRDICVE